LYTIAMGITNMVNNRLDPEHHHDAEAALHSTLVDTMGQTAANSVMDGPVSALSGASMSSGASYNDLWYRAPMYDQTWPETVTDLMTQAAGPMAGIPTNAAQGGQMLSRGVPAERAIEHFSPPAVQDLLKALRYYSQGATNTKGQNILPADNQINNWNIATQVGGFTPEKVFEAQKLNAAKMNEKDDMEARKRRLEEDYKEAIEGGNEKQIDEIQKQKNLWNLANPSLAISEGSISHGMFNDAKNNATAVQGFNGGRDYGYLNEKYK
ncbi:MAG TPA: PLxRFG domain-containing protein, partial [Steroidobacteraceae bacterium]|nr:PLxRFG domain-containing protein [Steroidobacteraceae bacterium]